MRTISFLILITVLCMLFVGCGSAPSTESKYDRYLDLIEYIEDDDYIGASRELASIMGRDPSFDTTDVTVVTSRDTTPDTTPVTTDAVTEKPEDKGPDYSMYESSLVGEWLPSNDEAPEYTSHPVFNADHTCTLFSETLTWEIHRVLNEGKADQQLELYLFIGDTHKYRVYLNSASNYDRLYVTNVIDSQYSPRYAYFRASDYTRVEITLDNIREYFEDRDIVEFQANAFGEINHVDVIKFLVAKEGCVVNPDISNVAVEYSHVTTEQSYTVDLDNRTVTFGEPTSRNTTPDINDTKLGLVYLGPDVRSYGHLYLCGSTPIQRFPTGTVYRDVFTITRVAGYIYINN